MIHEFRCWDNLTQKYTSNHHIVIDLNGNVTNLQNGSGSPELEIEQYTGKQDRHSKKIFAGDTVRFWLPDVYDDDDVILDKNNCVQTSSSNIHDLTSSEVGSNEHVIGWNRSYARWQVGLYGGIKSMGEYLFEITGNIHDKKDK